MLGSKIFLNQYKPEIILLEFNEMNIFSNTTFNDIKKIIGHKFKAYRLLPGGNLLPLENTSPLFTELYAYQNIVFINQN